MAGVNASSSDFSLTPLQIVSTTIFALSTSFSLLAYALVLIILCLYFHEFKSNFYCLVISLALADMIFLLLTVLYLIPCTILKKDVWPSAPYAPGVIEALGYFVQCTHLTYIAVNRLVYACVSGTKHPFLDKIFYSRFSVCSWIVLLWATGTVMPVLVHVAGCELIYDYEFMAFTYNCTDNVSPAFTNRILFLENFFAGLLPSLITVLHMAAWLAVCIKRKRNQQNAVNTELAQQRQREKRILIQFTLISVALIMYYASFWAIPYLFGNESPSLVLISYFAIASCAVNPFTCLAFNKLMKAKAKHLIFEVCLRRKNTVSDTVMAINVNGGKVNNNGRQMYNDAH